VCRTDVAADLFGCCYFGQRPKIEDCHLVSSAGGLVLSMVLEVEMLFEVETESAPGHCSASFAGERRRRSF